MQIKGIQIWEEVHLVENFQGDNFRKKLAQACGNIDNNTPENYIATYSYSLLKSIQEPRKLNIKEQLTLACLEVQAKIKIIWEWEKCIPSIETISQFSPEQMINLIDGNPSLWEVQERVRSIVEEIRAKKEQEDINCYLELLNEFNYQELSFGCIVNIYGILIEADMEDQLVLFLKEKGIETIYSEPVPKNILYMLYFSNGIFFIPGLWELQQLQKLRSPWEHKWTYFKSMSFNWTNALLYKTDNHVRWDFYVWEAILLDKKAFHIIRGDNWYIDLYNVKNDVLHSLNAFAYYIVNKESIRFYLDDEETLYIDFDGNDFSSIKKEPKKLETIVEINDDDFPPPWEDPKVH